MGKHDDRQFTGKKSFDHSAEVQGLYSHARVEVEILSQPSVELFCLTHISFKVAQKLEALKKGIEYSTMVLLYIGKILHRIKFRLLNSQFRFPRFLKMKDSDSVSVSYHSEHAYHIRRRSLLVLGII